MTSPKRAEVRIAIEGRYLDEVRIRQATPYDPRSVSCLSFPAERHWARVEGDRVTLSVQAATVVALFADGVLPAVGGRAVEIAIGGRKLGSCVLESVESGHTSAVKDAATMNGLRRSIPR